MNKQKSRHTYHISALKLCAVAALLGSAVLFSCKQQLLPQPDGFGQNNNTSNTNSSSWGSPSELKSSQGLQGRIELSWKPVQKAVRYYIYQAATPFDTFVQVGETTETNWSQKVSAGTDVYYRITAVNSTGTESGYSIAVRGTSLARPVISDIQGDSEQGDSIVTVYWYMNNIDAYEDAVRYEIVCYDSAGKEQQRLPGSSATTYCTIENLTPNTTYLYQVEAYNIAEQDKTETSDKIDAQTARRLRPDAPENLTVSQGSYGDKVQVSFTLPAKVDVLVEKNVYEQKPLYFKIYRKLAGEDDSLYLPVCAYLGSITSAAGSSGSVFAEQYTPGETVTWEDTNIVRGKQYEYKVQSYADDIERVITSDQSVATGTGWPVAPLSYQMNQAEYVDKFGEDGNPVSHETAKLSAKLTFDMQGKDSDYSYDLTVNYQRLNNTDGSLGESTSAQTKSFTSLDDLNAFIYEAALETNPGSYFFSVNVKHGTSGWAETVTTTNSRYVVADLQPLVVQNLTVADGYPDKFILTWDRDPSITYEIKYRKQGTGGTEFTLAEAVPAEPEASSDGTQNYTYEFTKYDGSTGNTSIKSGDAVYIQIIPFTDYNGDTQKAGNPESPDQLFYTLGTPAVTFDETKATADSITVSWPKIEKATSYEVTYAYDGVSGTTQILRDGIATTFAEAYKADTKIIPVTKEDEPLVSDDITCEIPKPIGYDYMAYSGKDVTVTVKAINETRQTQTTGTAATRTLGPAAAGVNATVAAKENSIDVSWKEVPGATGYLIARTRYGASNSDDSRSSDGEFVYFYNGTKLSILGYDEAKFTSTVAVQDGTFILSDTYSDSTDVAQDDPSRKFRIEQDKLGWGYPYRYQIFPVTESSPSFVRADNLNQCTVGNVTYQDADKNYVVGSAIGYGLDVKATKAESVDTVTVTWTKPYMGGTGTLKPVLLRVESGTSETSWTTYSQADFETEGSKATVHLSGDGANRNKAYDYVVKYVPDGSSGFTYSPLAAYTEAQKGDSSLDEPANKGYFFSVVGAEASKTDIKDGGASTFAEELSITPYNWTERKNGPEKYKVYVKNNNIDGNYNLVATIPVNKESYGTPAVNVSDISVTVSGSGLRFTPVFSGDVHGGLLKVLRDYKHYYKIEAVRTIKDSDGVEIEITAVLGDDDSIWGARQITAKEMVKAATLAMSEGMKRSWILRNGVGSNDKWSAARDGVTNTESTPGYGTSFFDATGGGILVVGTNVVHNTVYTNYTPVLTAKSGDKVTFLTINGKLTGETWEKTAIRPPTEYHNYNGPMKITGPEELRGLYDGEILFYWLNGDPNFDSQSSGKGIKISYPATESEHIFSNITPLPFVNRENGDNGYKQDSEEWL